MIDLEEKNKTNLNQLLCVAISSWCSYKFSVYNFVKWIFLLDIAQQDFQLSSSCIVLYCHQKNDARPCKQIARYRLETNRNLQ